MTWVYISMALAVALIFMAYVARDDHNRMASEVKASQHIEKCASDRSSRLEEDLGEAVRAHSRLFQIVRILGERGRPSEVRVTDDSMLVLWRKP